MSLPLARLRALAVTTTTALAASLLLLPTTSPADAAPAPAPAPAPAGPAGVVSKDAVGGLVVENSFVSSVGWVKPGETYPSRILVTNSGATPVLGAQVVVTAPAGTAFTAAGSGAAVSADGQTVTWSTGPVAATSTETLVLESKAATLGQLPTVVWRDLSSRAEVTVGLESTTVTSHGPKVIPPGEEFDTARYGDRPFPVVPVQYRDRAYNAHERTLDTVINDPAYPGSTFNLFQEMSLGQLYPDGTVPSDGIATADFTSYGPGFDFTQHDPATTNTCKGATGGATAPGTVGGPLYTERITSGVYNLPGQTEYYGSDSNGSALTGALAGVGALQAIDSGCGPTGKLVYDSAAIADPEIDYSDYDTDKDGVVDFFMVVFAGCGGNGASQLAACTSNTSDLAPYDNVWPHSSSLEFYYSDPETGQPGYTTDDQLRNLEDEPLFYTTEERTEMTTAETPWKVFVRVGPYNVNPETAIDAASVISHEYGHSLGLPDFYSTGSRETYGDWNLMATDKSHNMDAFSRQEMGWVVPEVLDSSRTETGITDSKQDTDTITWQQADGTPYTLTEGEAGVRRVQNAQMYVAKLPGRILLDPAKFETGDKATPVHTWWSRSGNDFGCAKDVGKGHNIDLNLQSAAFDSLPEGTTLSLEFKSMWDIEWDYDYGFVLTSTDGGQKFGSNESENGFTTSNTDPVAGNPNQNACQQHYDHGITGSSGSYDAGSEALDRKTGEYPPMVYKADAYDISELVGSDMPVLRFSYATDPGLARPGWFIDDVKVVATLPDNSTQEIFASDFESSGDPDDPRIFNGGCQADGPGGRCTQGWQYVAAGTEGPSDHAYYLEMRDRSGFDVNGKGQNDREAIAFEAGFYNAYTDEAHGYGNAGTDDPPAQSPLDSTPQPGENAPDLNDAAWRPGDPEFSDFGAGHTDNYADPSSEDGNWHFRYDCLSYDVTAMSGEDEGPETSDGNLTGSVAFTLGQGCGSYDYGYGEEDVAPGDSTAPDAVLGFRPRRPFTTTRITLSAAGSSDDTTAGKDLAYGWDFNNDGRSDATGAEVTKRFRKAGRHKVALTVTDEAGNSTSVGKTIPVRRLIRCRAERVTRTGGWEEVRNRRANGGSYCRNDADRTSRDVLQMRFRGGRLAVIHADAARGGRAAVHIDGKRVETLSFRGDRRRLVFGKRLTLSGLGKGAHTVRIVMQRGRGYVEGFVMRG